jgi:hypothetical protein
MNAIDIFSKELWNKTERLSKRMHEECKNIKKILTKHISPKGALSPKPRKF